MPILYCDLDGTRDVNCGLAEPLTFEGGYADVEDGGEASRIVATHKHIHYVDNHPGARIESDDESVSKSAPVIEEETCSAVMESGEVCDRALPCGYHPDGE